MSAKNPVKKVETRIKDHDLIDQRRRQIAEGAMRLFVAKGFHTATVREIAEASGMTMGSMYNYVRSKEDIIYIVYDHITRILRQEMNKAIDGIEDPRERLEAALKHNLESINRYADMVMFTYQASRYLDRDSLHEVLARETEYIELFEDLLRQRLAGQNVSDVRIRLAADILSYLPVIMTQRRWSLKKRFVSFEEVMEGILDFALNGIEFVSKDKRTIRSLFGGGEEK